MSVVAPVGIIANPASGRDIRRLVAHATTVDNQGKVGIIRRVLIGLGALNTTQVLAMPDSQHMVQQAVGGLAHCAQPVPQVTMLDMATTHLPADSRIAAAMMQAQGAGCIIVLGGDGTVRVVSQGAGEVPLLPISTGTNNVLPAFVEGTMAGLAAAAVAAEIVPLGRVAHRHKWLDVMVNEETSTRALVDLALLRARFVGARAVWQADDLRRIVVTRAATSSIGITSVAAMVEPVGLDAAWGLALTIDAAANRQVLAALGPGLLERVGIEHVERLFLGQPLHWQVEGSTMLALDGEREIALRAGDTVSVSLRADGPWIVDTDKVMDALVAQRLMDR